MESGGDLLSRAVSSQVPSALKGLTSVFGMGTGGTPSPLPPETVFTSHGPRFACPCSLSTHYGRNPRHKPKGLFLRGLRSAAFVASVSCRSSYLPKVPLLPLGVFLSAGVPFGLSPASGLLTRFGHIFMCQVQCVLRFFVLSHFPRPLSHLDNCTSERRLCVSYVSLFSQTFVSVSLKSSPRPISIIKLHTLPYFHR